jgi:F0F1-type ATP synthase membrane subunit b/b'
MNFPISLFLTAGGLFDFDLTFVAEAILFLLLAFVVTFVFLGPVTKQLDERAELINYTLRKSTILLTFGYEKLSNCLELLTLEIAELNRQLKLTRTYTQSHFEEEVNLVQKENGKILSKLKGQLAIQSASILASITPDLNRFIDAFFTKKFQS